MSERPKRCYELKITIGADDWPEVVRCLKHLLPHIEDHGPACNSVSGGASSGWIVDIQHRPEMNNEKYHEALDAYLDESNESTPRTT